MLIKSEISNFYRDKLSSYGASAQGVGWKDSDAQQIRFEQLLKIIDNKSSFSINDVGCGTGDIIPLLNSKFKNFHYTGYDAVEEMIVTAKQKFKENESIHFQKITDYNQIAFADFSIASGIFNVRNTISDHEWKAYIVETIDALNKVSGKGFAFNALTSYSDADKMRADLYYSDPLFFFDYCKKKFSRNVALLHDYEIYDFTILVKKG